MSRQLTYAETIAWGAREWSDVIERIRQEGQGWAGPSSPRPAGCAPPSSSASKTATTCCTPTPRTPCPGSTTRTPGWYVGLYPPENEDSSEPIAYLEHPHGDADTLIRLIRDVLRDGTYAAADVDLIAQAL